MNLLSKSVLILSLSISSLASATIIDNGDYIGAFQIAQKAFGGGRVSLKTNTGADSGAGSIRLIGVWVGGLSF